MMFANRFFVQVGDQTVMLQFKCEALSEKLGPCTTHVASVALSRLDAQALVDVLGRCLKGEGNAEINQASARTEGQA